MWPAFPTSDYYGGSVAIGLSPLRRSRISFLSDVQDGLGVSFMLLWSFVGTLLRGTLVRTVRTSILTLGFLALYKELTSKHRMFSVVSGLVD